MATPFRLPGFGRAALPLSSMPGSRATLETVLITLAALAISLVAFGIFLTLVGAAPVDVFRSIYRGGFGTSFSWENTLIRAAPLMLVALCTALPAQLGLIVIGGDGSILLGGLAAAMTGLLLTGAPAAISMPAMAIAAALVGMVFIGLIGALRHYRGVNETIASLLASYLALSLFTHLVQGPLRDPGTQNYPGTFAFDASFAVGEIPGTDIHYGLAAGVLACVIAWVVVWRTPFGHAMRITGGNVRAARLAGFRVGALTVSACAMGGAAAGLAGYFEVAAVVGRANSSLDGHYGLSAVLVSFVARHNPLLIIPAAIAVGGIRASSGLVQRTHDLPDATILVFEGIVFLAILWCASWQGRTPLTSAG